MEPKAHHVLIGLFTILIMILGITVAIWLSKSYNGIEQRYFTIIFKDGVSGLSKGSAVQYSGIKVGEVTALKLDPSDPRQVIARIELPATLKIKSDVHAKFQITGVTGLSVIALSGGTSQAPVLEGDTNPKGDKPIIIASQSGLAALFSNGEDLMQNVTKLLVNANRFLSPENSKHITDILSNTAKVTAFVEQGTDTLKGIWQEIADVVKYAREALVSIQETATTTHTLLTDEGREAFSHAQSAMANLDKASDALRAMLTSNVSAVNQGAQGVAKIGPAMTIFKEAVSTLQEVLQEFKQDPLKYIIQGKDLKEYKP